MADKKKKTSKINDDMAVEWGENHQERILDHSERHESARHVCKGRHCDTAFEKL